jgi:predicted PurR-regulated permease PerM
MSLERQVIFWVAALVIFSGLLWLLSPVLLPFIAGMALAYLLDPLTRQVERTGLGRVLSALVVITLIIVVLVVIIILVAPVLGDQLFAFVDNIPRYMERLQALISDPNRAWLRKIFGGQVSDPGKSVGGLMAQGATWLAAFLASLWSGGRALVSLFSLLIITPVVAFYLLCDWDRLLVTVDNWIPLPHRETVRGLAREMDAAIAGFMRGQAVICLILGVFYAVGLTLCGLHFGFLIGFGTGVMSFVPYVGALTGFFVAGGVDPCGVRGVRGRAVAGGLHSLAEAGRSQGRAASGLADVLAARLRLPVRLCRVAGGDPARCGDRRAGALCVATVSREPALHRRRAALSHAGC